MTISSLRLAVAAGALLAIAGCENKTNKQVPTQDPVPQVKQPENDVMIHLNTLVVCDSPGRTVALTSALSCACGELPGGKAVDPDNLRKVKDATQPVIVEYRTKHRVYSQMIAARSMRPQSVLYLAGMADGALLAIDNKSLPSPEVCTQLFLLRAAGVNRIAVVIDQEVADKQVAVSPDLETLLNRIGFTRDEWAVVSGRLEGSDANKTAYRLLDVMDKLLVRRHVDDNGKFLFVIEDVFNIKGRGVIVTGKIERGTLRPNDEIDLIGNGRRKTVKCRSIEYIGGNMEVARSGDNIGILLSEITPNDVARGTVLCKHGSLDLKSTFEATVTVMTAKESTASEPLVNGWRGLAVVGRVEEESSVHLVGNSDALRPGETGKISVTVSAVVAIENDFSLVLHNAEGKVIAVGRVNLP